MKTRNLHMDKYMNPEYWVAYLLALLIWMRAFVVPVAPFLLLSTALVISDLWSGTRAARKRGEIIHSKGLRRTVEKFFLYFLAILLAEGMRTVFLPSAPFTYVVALAICITEFQSTVENIETVTGVNIWNRVKDYVSHFWHHPKPKK